MGTALSSTLPCGMPLWRLVVHLPGVPSFEGPESSCASGLGGCSYLNCERHGADTSASLLECVLRCKCAVHKSLFWWCCAQCQLFNPSDFQGFSVARRVSGGAGFPITLALIFFENQNQMALWICTHLECVKTTCGRV